MVLENLEPLNWRALIDVDLPKLDIPYVFKSGVIETPQEYEAYREKSLSTKLP